MGYELIVGDCRTELAALPDASVDAVVTDPPYELAFMGKAWDASGVAYDVTMWAEVLRVLKPGGHLLAFGGTRTSHRMVCAIEDAGFQIRDNIYWLYSSGFPKSLNVGKAIDKAAGAKREVVGSIRMDQAGGDGFYDHVHVVGGYVRGDERTRPIFGAPATPEAERWEGWGTALKPAHEPIVVARKPLVGTVAANVLAYGTGALNIDASRISMGDEYDPSKVQRQQNSAGAVEGAFGAASLIGTEIPTYNPAGRWPANVIVGCGDDCGEDHADGCPAAGMNAQADGADVARFFYSPKANKRQRAEGMPDGETNNHPTVKPIALMEYLVRLVTPLGGTVLDPFTGSGTTGIAALREGFHFIGVEQSEDYVERITRPRLDAALLAGRAAQ